MVVGGAWGTGLANDAGSVTAQVVEGAVAGVYVPVADVARVFDGYARTCVVTMETVIVRMK